MTHRLSTLIRYLGLGSILLFPLLALSAPEIALPQVPLNYCRNTINKSAFTVTEEASDQIARIGSTSIYQTEYDSASWSGTVKKYALQRKDDNSLVVASQPLWDAAARLNAMPDQDLRNIATWQQELHTTVPFRYAQLPEPTRFLFNQAPYSGQQDDLGIARVDYLYGDHALEVLPTNSQTRPLRPRKNLLGDVINSTPVCQCSAEKTINDPDYLPFFNQSAQRSNTIYVGANDGMLHAFSADTGAELFAYIPGPLLNKLPALTDPGYQHDFYMDGKIRLGTAQINGIWTSVLTAGMGSGAKGLFALDVTSPGPLTNDHGTLFEFTDKDDADMGFVMTAPQIAKMASGTDSDGVARYRYFIIVPGGYNTANPGGEQFLFLLSLDKAPQTPWVVNKNYYKLKAGSDNKTVANALASPGLVLNKQGALIYAYAGDLQGHLWRFDFSDGENALARAGQLLFKAVSRENIAQPVTTEPAIAFAPGQGYLILFGTGKYIEEADTRSANFISHSFYAIHDGIGSTDSTDRTDSADSTAKAAHLITKNELADRSLTSASVDGIHGYQISAADFTLGANSAQPKKGWVIDFPDSRKTGERSITPPVLAFGNVIFNTFIPDLNGCNSAGTSVSYRFDALSGKSAGSDKLTGVKTANANLGTPILILTGTTVGERNPVGQRSSTQTYSILNFGQGADRDSIIPMMQDQSVIKSGRLSWREIQNWQDLK